jgi:hypothetical protein
MTPIRIAAVAASLLALASAASAADHVVVINTPTAPVPVLVTNPQGAAAQPVQKSFLVDVFPPTTTQAVPPPGAGKRFVVKNISLIMFSNISGIPLSDAGCVVSMHQGSVSFSIAAIPLQHADTVGGLGVSLPVYYVLGPTDTLDITCLSNPSNSGGRATFSGDLVAGS